MKLRQAVWNKKARAEPKKNASVKPYDLGQQ
jgi:hypothetical protein